MIRISDRVRTGIIVAGGIIGVLGASLFILGLAAPEAISSLGYGNDYLISGLTAETSSVIEMLRLKPAMDIVLLVTFYIAVCLLLHLQELVRDYVGNRSHFK